MMTRNSWSRLVWLPLLAIALVQVTAGIGWAEGTPDKAAAIQARRAKIPTLAQRKEAAKRAAEARKASVASGKAPQAATKGGKATQASRAAFATPPQGGTPNYFGPEPNWAWSPSPAGQVAAITVTDGGSGYSNNPTVTITDDRGTGSGAAASATVVGGVITAITINPPGNGYTHPVVAITDATGVGATATASIGGTLTGGMRKFVDSLPGLTAAGANNLGNFIPVAVPDTITYPGSDYYEIELREYTQQMHSDLNPTTLRGYVQTNKGTDNTVSPPANTIAPAPNKYLGPVIVGTKGRPVRVKFTNKLATGAGGNLFLPVDTTLMGAGMGPLGANTTPGKPMNYTQNRAAVHLHGHNAPWMSDGSQNQWVTPAGESTDYPEGLVVNVPDMPDPGPGAQTLYYPNQQGSRLQFYHDHAKGITRLNVYAGMASGYLITDPTEQDLIARGILPDIGIPLVVQDKTFIDPAKLLITDPTWPFALDTTKSNLWLPHVYMPNQNPNDLAGVNPFGRWDYGPWFWPPWPTTYPPITLPDGTQLPNLPDLSTTMEAFMDTPLVNGTPYPYLNVDPKTYRFRILNAANDRMFNLQLYVADPAAATEVRMVPAVIGAANFPAAWTARTTGQPGDILDGREGGVPDPALMGPSMIQIGTEGGFLPTPVIQPNIPIGYDRDPKSITIGNIKEHNLFLAPAERADVIIDFSQFAGKTVILYNDAQAAVPAADYRLDYYTGDVDSTDVAGAPPTLPGYGPNIRTVMQFRVANKPPAVAYNVAALNAEFTTTATQQGVFARSQDPILVPQAPYNSAYGGTFPAGTTAYERIQNMSLTFNPLDVTQPNKLSLTPITVANMPKAITELFEDNWGRMNALLGVEVKFTNGQNQTTIPYTVQDPVTEIVDDSVTVAPATAGDGTQLWKITHNGVDTHPIHFHLFNVQVVNRVDWAGVIKPPDPNELGWKETVRMNPLEDCIVALRPVSAKCPFGSPDAIRPLAPELPIGSGMGFKNVDPQGNPITVINDLYNFGWEYVWHCHILSHEEMDMMRPMQFNVARQLAAAPVLSATGFTDSGGPINLSWTDGTPVANPSTLGNPANEIGFRIERADITGGVVGAYTAIGAALANVITYSDATVAGTAKKYSYRVVAFNAAGDSASAPITVGPSPVVITTASLPDGKTNVLYPSQTLAATGGVPGYTWSLSAGNLPPGVNLSGAGVISGTPTLAGTYNFTVGVVDSTGAPATKALSIRVVDPIVITNASPLPAGGRNVPYSQQLAATGGVPAYTWSLSSGSLPTGLNLSTSGLISGTPTVNGTYNFTIGVVDSTGAPGSKAFSIRIANPVSITTTSLPGGTVGVQYSRSLAATGGVTPYTWSVDSGAMPGGLNLVASTGNLNGRPTATGTFNFTMRVTDSIGLTATQPLSIVVGVNPLSVTTTSLPGGTVGAQYSRTLAATGGVTPYTWSVVVGALPGGLTLVASTGNINGRPTVAGTFNFTVQVKDSQGTTATQPLSIVVGVAPLTITTSSLPNATRGASYYASLAATGGQPPYTYTVSVGSLPAGLSVSLNASTGVWSIGGRPTSTAVTSTFTLRVSDGIGTTPATKQFTITVN